MARAVVAVCWLVVAGLGVAALARIVEWDGLWWPFVLLDALTTIAYLPAWLIAVLACALRRLGLALAALALVACQILFLLPEWSAAAPLPRWAARAPVLRLVDANVSAFNPTTARYAAVIRAARADLVTLEEATPPQVAALEATGALARLHYRYQVDWENPFAFLVASRYPLDRVHTVFGNGEPLAVSATVQLPSGPLHLLVVHTVAPVPVSWRAWESDLGIVARLVRHLGTRRLLVVGDFNATWGNRGFAGIIGTGLSDAAAARADPLAMTWPQGFVLPPFVRIDHVLTGADVAVRTLVTRPGPGSDHRALVATVALRRG